MGDLRRGPPSQDRGPTRASEKRSVPGVTVAGDIPKEDGSKRPLAVAALEDKIVQRATAAVLSAFFEEDFLGFSYGFRPRRSQHDALDALIVGISSKSSMPTSGRASRRYPRNGSSASWSTGSAVSALFGSSRNALRAGVLEDGVVTIEEAGTGQGSGAAFSRRTPIAVVRRIEGDRQGSTASCRSRSVPARKDTP